MYSLNIYWSQKYIKKAHIICYILNSFEGYIKGSIHNGIFMLYVCFQNLLVCVMYFCHDFSQPFYDSQFINLLRCYFIFDFTESVETNFFVG